MPIEVEQKFAVADFAAIEAALAELGAIPGTPRQECDLYYRHPQRDFARTDEALRVRRAGAGCFLTYKGPKLDAVTKTRREIEIPLGAGTAATAGQLLDALGFQPLAEVRKSRRKARVRWEDRSVEVSLDDVEQVGRFVELELLVEEFDLDAARQAVARLAQRLKLHDGERRSYLELLLASES